MQMINVLKRLAELDANNTNVVYEGKVKELAQDLKSMSDAEFKKTYKKTKAEAKAGMKSEKAPAKKDDKKKSFKDTVKEALTTKKSDKDSEVDEDADNSVNPVSTVSGNNKIKSPEEMTKGVGEEPDDEDDETDDTDTMTTESLKHLAGIKKTSVKECGEMMGASALIHPAAPANISITAASGSELSAMLKDIMSLAGVKQVSQQDMPIVSKPEVAVTDYESSADNISDTSVDTSDIPMRKMLDTMNSVEEEGYDNTPHETVAGIDASTPSGTDMNKSKRTFAKVAGGDNPMQSHTNESASFMSHLYAEYEKFKKQ